MKLIGLRTLPLELNLLIAFFSSVTYLCPVKYLCLLLSLFVLLVSAAPCCCQDDCGQTESKVAQTNQPSKSHPEGDDCKACSPFLTCGSCSGFIKPLPAPTFQVEVIGYQTELVDAYHFSTYPLVSSSFWQPPKIA